MPTPYPRSNPVDEDIRKRDWAIEEQARALEREKEIKDLQKKYPNNPKYSDEIFYY